MKQIYLFNESNIFYKVDLIDDDAQVPVNSTIIKPPDGLYKAKFDGEKWTETITEEELAERNKVIPSLTVKERVDVLEGAVVEIMETTL